MFNSGENRIMLTMITAGGTGISLHDRIGGMPRYTLLSPPESATTTIQALGRVDRIGAKTDSIQRIIFVKDTIEEKIAESLNKKIQTIGDLNGDDNADNLFLFEVFHEYEQEDKEDTDFKSGTISVAVDRKNQRLVVSVPDYMIDSFEDGLPKQCVAGMKVRGERYLFDIVHQVDIVEFLNRLNE
jgi:hypothetical protein